MRDDVYKGRLHIFARQPQSPDFFSNPRRDRPMHCFANDRESDTGPQLLLSIKNIAARPPHYNFPFAETPRRPKKLSHADSSAPCVRQIAARQIMHQSRQLPGSVTGTIENLPAIVLEHARESLTKVREAVCHNPVWLVSSDTFQRRGSLGFPLFSANQL